MIVVGIDPGVETGIAMWDAQLRELRKVESHSILESMDLVLQWRNIHHVALVIFEDARLRKWRGSFGELDEKTSKYGAGVREGVGSVKRDCSIWQEFLTRHRIPFEARYPRNTKLEPEEFERVTGWKGRTNKHARDAAMVVHGLNRPMAQGLLRVIEERKNTPQVRQRRKARGGRR